MIAKIQNNNSLNNKEIYLNYQKFFNEVQEPYLAIRMDNQTDNLNFPQISLNRQLNYFTNYLVII